MINIKTNNEINYQSPCSDVAKLTIEGSWRQEMVAHNTQQ